MFAIFFQIYFEVKYKCVYLHSLSETVLSNKEKVSSFKRLKFLKNTLIVWKMKIFRIIAQN